MYNRQSCNIKRDGLTQVFSWMNLRSIEWSGVKKKKQDTKIMQQNYHLCKIGKMYDGDSLYFQEIHMCM